ncbi:hypothetical protein [Comamonas antarctica]|uniref:hypothetical protein n=1 Tax=Comamonas antarctica TaxID=2743470 RepID=UPI0028E2A419|nr:hypothetical protein [Comamonas antarctica]
MSPSIYAVVNSDGYITALVNAQLLPEIEKQANAVPAPDLNLPLVVGSVWRTVKGDWVQVPDPHAALIASTSAALEE